MNFRKPQKYNFFKPPRFFPVPSLKPSTIFVLHYVLLFVLHDDSLYSIKSGKPPLTNYKYLAY